VTVALIPDEQAALLAAIVADPDDDAPRLVYADWLQEHGDEEQAEFIRESIKLSWMPRGADGRDELFVRLLGLEGARGEAWIKGVGLQVAPLGWANAGFERGLLTEAVYRRVRDFIAEGPILFARFPVCKLTISYYPYSNDAQKFIAMPELARLRSLTLGAQRDFHALSRLCPNFLNAVIHSPHLSGLRELFVMDCELRDEHLFALADCPNLTALTTLDLSGKPQMTTPYGQLAILRSPHLAGIKKLSLANGDEPENKELIRLVVARFGSDAPLLRSLSDQE
jgi:uncharacterized protein (TIGR02996 family)